MSQFLNNAKYVYLSNSKRRIGLTRELVYIDDDGAIYVVPIGFKSDGLSIPWLFRWYQKPFGKGLEAGLLHDYLLDSPQFNMPFTECNNIFRRALKALGVRGSKRKILEWATDLNGLIVHGNKNPNTWHINQK